MDRQPSDESEWEDIPSELLPARQQRLVRVVQTFGMALLSIGGGLSAIALTILVVLSTLPPQVSPQLATTFLTMLLAGVTLIGVGILSYKVGTFLAGE